MFTQQDDKAKGRSAKQMLSTQKGTERRQRQLMTLRHKTQGEKLKQLRGEGDVSEGDDDNHTSGSHHAQQGPMDIWAYNHESKPTTIPVALLPQFVQLVMSGEAKEQVFHGTNMIRKLLSVEKDPPYEAVTSSGVVPHIVAQLDRNDFPELQFEAAWALTNISAGTSENTMHVVQCGAIPKLIGLLSSVSADCRDQSAWGIGNLAGEGASCRDEALNNGAMPALLNLLVDPSQPLNVLRNATWAASNLCRCKPQPVLESVAMALPVLAQLLHHADPQIVIDAAWGISYVSDGPPERAQAVLESGVLQVIVGLLSAPSTSLKTPAIRIVGNIAAGSDAQTQMVINAGALAAMAQLLRHQKRAIRKETCWTISNIAAGPMEQIQALINANIFIAMLDCLQALELDVRKEAVWSVSNVTMCGTVDHVKYLVNIGVIPPLCDTLRTYDPKIVIVALEALQVFLQVAEDERQAGTMSDNIVSRQMHECGGIDYLEGLQKHSNRNVYNLALGILETFFPTEEDAAFGAEAGGGGVGTGGMGDGAGGGQAFNFDAGANAGGDQINANNGAPFSF